MTGLEAAVKGLRNSIKRSWVNLTHDVVLGQIESLSDQMEELSDKLNADQISHKLETSDTPFTAKIVVYASSHLDFETEAKLNAILKDTGLLSDFESRLDNPNERQYFDI